MVLNFARFYFHDFNRQTWKKGIKFRDLSKFPTSFHLSKSLNLLKFVDKLGQDSNVWNLCKLTLFHNYRYNMEWTIKKLVDLSIHILYILLLLGVNKVFRVLNFKFCGNLNSQQFNFANCLKTRKMWNLRPAKLSTNKGLFTLII